MASARPTSRTSPEPALQLASLLERLLSPEALVLDARLRLTDATPRARQWLRLDTGARNARLPAAVRAIARAALRARAGGELPRANFTPRGNPALRLQANAWRLNRGGASAGVLVLLQERGEPERIAQTLAQIQRLSSLGLLTASLAHELKNALVPVKTFLDLALETGRVPELGEDARRELQRINALVEQVLRFSRTGRHLSAPVRVHQVLEEALRLVQRRLEERLIRLERRFEAPNDLVEGDAVQLQQAFLNLLLNALEAMSVQGVLTVATRLEEPAAGSPSRPLKAGRTDTKPTARLCVCIADTGIGIAPEHLGHIFDPFFTTKPGGTGLGLAMARRIAQEHGGDITVESQLNQGTTFHVKLPLATRR